MTIEHAIANSLPKPWGVVDPRPWSSAGREDHAIGEIWYERSNSAAIAPALLLKLLFTTQPLSIQVHPGFAIMAAVASFISIPPLRWRMPDLPAFKSRHLVWATVGFSWPQTLSSHSKRSIWRQTRLGAWKRNERPGFSSSAAVRAPARL